jgi:hypothetical protein
VRNRIRCAVVVEDRVHALNVAPLGIMSGKSAAIFLAPWRAGLRSTIQQSCYGGNQFRVHHQVRIDIVSRLALINDQRLPAMSETRGRARSATRGRAHLLTRLGDDQAR